MRITDLSYHLTGCMAVFAFLLAAACLPGLVRSFVMEAEFRFRILFAGMMLPCLVLMQGLESVCVQMTKGEVSSRIMDITLRMPVWFAAAALTILLACVILSWIQMERQLSTALTKSSIQEGLNYLPDGISFSTKDGIPLMVNRKMLEICDMAFGTGALNAKELSERLKAGNLAQGCYVQQKGDAIFLHLPDGSSHAVYDRTLTIGKTQVLECIACDITEQYRKSREMKMRNERMASVNEKIREYNDNLDSVIRERELLAAKIRIHDDVGRSLLALRSYLAHENGDKKSLTDQWRFTIAALKREEVSRDRVDQIEALTQAAQAVGVKLIMEEELPDDPKLLEVAAAAIHECLTNTVKHANGSELTVHTKIEKRTVTLELKNNGKIPEGPVEEKGGLRTLRTVVEQHGGSMEIDYKPVFLLRIRISLVLA